VQQYAGLIDGSPFVRTSSTFGSLAPYGVVNATEGVFSKFSCL